MSTIRKDQWWHNNETNSNVRIFSVSSTTVVFNGVDHGGTTPRQEFLINYSQGKWVLTHEFTIGSIWKNRGGLYVTIQELTDSHIGYFTELQRDTIFYLTRTSFKSIYYTFVSPGAQAVTPVLTVLTNTSETLETHNLTPLIVEVPVLAPLTPEAPLPETEVIQSIEQGQICESKPKGINRVRVLGLSDNIVAYTVNGMMEGAQPEIRFRDMYAFRSNPDKDIPSYRNVPTMRIPKEEPAKALPKLGEIWIHKYGAYDCSIVKVSGNSVFLQRGSGLIYEDLTSEFIKWYKLKSISDTPLSNLIQPLFSELQEENAMLKKLLAESYAFQSQRPKGYGACMEKIREVLRVVKG